MKAKISLSIVAYKNYKDIIRAIKSIEKFSVIKKRIYIIDNSNYPPTHQERIQFVNVISQYEDIEYLDAGKNLGFGKGHNYVLDDLESSYHAIVNPDIIFLDDCLSNIINYMEKDETIGMCIPKILNKNGKMQLAYRKEVTIFDMFIRMFCKELFPKRMRAHTLQDKDYSKPFQVPFGQGSFLVIRTDLFKFLKGFDNKFFMYLEDADLCKRVNQISKLMYFPGASVIHNWECGSHKSLKLFIFHIRSMIVYFTKWNLLRR